MNFDSFNFLTFVSTGKKKWFRWTWRESTFCSYYFFWTTFWRRIIQYLCFLIPKIHQTVWHYKHQIWKLKYFSWALSNENSTDGPVSVASTQQSKKHYCQIQLQW